MRLSLGSIVLPMFPFTRGGTLCVEKGRYGLRAKSIFLRKFFDPALAGTVLLRVDGVRV